MNLSNLQGRDSQLLGGLLEGDQELLALFNCSFSTQQQQPSYGQIPVECTNDHNIPRTQGLCPAASVNGLVSGKKRKRKEEKDGKQPAEGVILVRAKRGQATDSHSLAEKARRERINDRLRRLQDLVPGCYKTMGMAMMLEAITNYVRSLQNQIEFLSMKLSAATMYSTDVINTERGIMENNEGGWLGNIWT